MTPSTTHHYAIIGRDNRIVVGVIDSSSSCVHHTTTTNNDGNNPTATNNDPNRVSRRFCISSMVFFLFALLMTIYNQVTFMEREPRRRRRTPACQQPATIANRTTKGDLRVETLLHLAQYVIFSFLFFIQILIIYSQLDYYAYTKQ
jgi:hypothetical protein